MSTPGVLPTRVERSPLSSGAPRIGHSEIQDQQVRQFKEKITNITGYLINNEMPIIENLTQLCDTITPEQIKYNRDLSSNLDQLDILLRDESISINIKKTALLQICLIEDDRGQINYNLKRAILTLNAGKNDIQRNLETATHELIKIAAKDYLKSCAQDVTYRNLGTLIRAVTKEFGLTESSYGPAHLRDKYTDDVFENTQKGTSITERQINEFKLLLRQYITDERLARKLGETIAYKMADVAEQSDATPVTEPQTYSPYEVVNIGQRQAQEDGSQPHRIQSEKFPDLIEVVDSDGKEVGLKVFLPNEGDLTREKQLQHCQEQIGIMMLDCLPSNIDKNSYKTEFTGRNGELQSDAFGQYWVKVADVRKPVDLAALKRIGFNIAFDEQHFHQHAAVLEQALSQRPFKFSDLQPFLSQLAENMHISPETPIYQQVKVLKNKETANKVAKEDKQQNFKKFFYQILTAQLVEAFESDQTETLFGEFEYWLDTQQTSTDELERLAVLVPCKRCINKIYQKMEGIWEPVERSSTEVTRTAVNVFTNAVRRDDVNTLRKWIIAGGDVNVLKIAWHRVKAGCKDAHPIPLLHFTVAHGNPLATKIMLDTPVNKTSDNKNKDIDIAARDEFGDTVFHIAVMSRNPHTLAVLLAHPNAQPNVDNAGRTPLQLAASKGDLNSVKLLLAHPDVSQNMSHNEIRRTIEFAVRGDHAEVVHHLLNHDKFKSSFKGSVAEYLSPLDLAVKYHCNNVVRKLINESSPDITERNMRLRTCLHTAAKFGNKEATKLLLEVFTVQQVNRMDLEFKTAKNLASQHKYTEIVQMITDFNHSHQSDQIQNQLMEQKHPDVALYRAAIDGHITVIKRLLKPERHHFKTTSEPFCQFERADTGRISLTETSASFKVRTLRGAIKNNHIDVVCILLQKGNVDLFEDLGNGLTPFDMLLKYQKVDMLKEVVKDKELSIKKLQEGLLFAADNGKPESVEYILTKLTSKQVIEFEERLGENSPISRANSNNHTEIARMIKHHIITPPALHNAVAENDEQAVKKLIEFDVDIKAQDSQGTAVHTACRLGNEQMLNVLLGKWPTFDLQIKNSAQETPLHLALKYRTPEGSINEGLVFKLASYRSVIGATGSTLFHEAVHSGQKEWVDRLFGVYCDTFECDTIDDWGGVEQYDNNYRDSYGNTAAHIALENKDNKLLLYLIKRGGISLEMKNNKGVTLEMLINQIRLPFMREELKLRITGKYDYNTKNRPPQVQARVERDLAYRASDHKYQEWTFVDS